MTRHFFISFSLIAFTLSCSLIIKSEKIQNEIEIKDNTLTKIHQQSCQLKKPQLQFLGGSELFQKQYSQILKKYQHLNLKLEEKFLLGLFTLMQFRPDQFTNTARIQIMHFKRKLKYQETSHSPENTLYSILQKFGDLKKINSLISKSGLSPKAGNDLKENLAISQYNFIPNDPKKAKAFQTQYTIDKFAKYFKRGENLIVTGEGLKSFNVLGFLQYQHKQSLAIKKSNYFIQPTLFKNEELNVTCNIDLKLYQNAMQIISKDVTRPSLFAVSDGIDFIVISSIQDFKDVSIDQHYPVLLSSRYSRPLPFCWRENEKSQIQFTGVSYSRDMGQLMFNVLSLGIFDQKDNDKVIEVINYPRNIILQNPPRILVENHLKNDEALAQFQSLRLPVYGVKQLGRIFFTGNSSNNSKMNILGDNRAYEFNVQCN